VDLGIRGRKALLSGASRGLGRACAFALACEGVDVTIVARTHDALETTGAEIAAATGVKVTTVVGDITTTAGRSAALAACPAPDILLNNADGPPPGDYRDWSREDWIAALDAMMLSPIEMMRLTVDGMMARGFGRIVNIVSRSVKIPQLELGLSNGARSGLVGFVAGLARQTVGRNVTINNLLPGIFDGDAQFAGCWRQRARASTSFGAHAARPIRPNAMAARRSLGPIAPFCARTTPVSLPAKIFSSTEEAIRGHIEYLERTAP
jgi:3-oxoacyl-[acyl-carrier protein] reductase